MYVHMLIYNKNNCIFVTPLSNLYYLFFPHWISASAMHYGTFYLVTDHWMWIYTSFRQCIVGYTA